VTADDSPAPVDAASRRAVERLPEATVERIAAGEVVTRPAAVVRELVENALDAGAESVEVEVGGDGTGLLRVADDGRGMTREDARRAVERHTTSKLRGGDDLSRVTTLGFRGEALPSIAEAGRLELTTAPATGGGDGGGGEDGESGERRSEERATRVVVADGEVRVSDAGRAPGTTVEVRSLFADRPARRKSLGGPKAEFARISDAVAGYALVLPDVRFRLVHDGTETFAAPGSGDYVDAALAVYDRTVASRSTAFDASATADLDGREREVGVEGLLCYPSVTRTSADHVHVAVNGRVVRDDAVRRAVESAYGSLVPDGRHPVAVVRLDVPPETVDANVHPAKREVAHADADAVAGVVERAVRDALSTADLRRTGDVAMDLDSALAPPEGETDSRLADAAYLGQFRGTYLLLEAGDDLLVVDQHAAHERVNFERLRAAVGGGRTDDGEGAEGGSVPTRRLDPPETVSLPPGETATVEAERETLRELGFNADPFGGGTVRLRTVPAPLGRVADVDAFRETVAALHAGDVPDPADARDDLLADLACHPSLKAGDELADADARELVDRLAACERPFACPHGRPTVLTVEESTLIRGFERGPRLG